jgi:galactokinase/mevalonate kinase-like predicted kinase
MRLFDIVLITASSERQAGAFRQLIQRRREHGLYPRELDFAVVADPPGGRVGTGGSTLWSLHRLVTERGVSDPQAFLSESRILLLHAGGESRRLPCFAPEGKLFAPLPMPSSSVLPPVVLDAHLSLFLKYPWRRGEVVVSSGDVVIDFDADVLPEGRGPVFGFAKPAPLGQGARHGVFQFDATGERVTDYFQKAPAEYLAHHALIEGSSECALDIGLVSLAPNAGLAFLDLGRADVGGRSVLSALAEGRLRFDLYLEVLTACLSSLDREAFLDRVRPAGEAAGLLARHLYDRFHPFGLGASLTRGTTFVHVGQLAELGATCRELLVRGLVPFYETEPGELRAQDTPDRIVFDSANVEIGHVRGEPVVAEGCVNVRLGAMGGRNLLVGLSELSLSEPVPEGMCIDERRPPQGPVYVVYSTEDSFKPNVAPGDIVFCGKPLERWAAERGLAPSELLSASEPSDLFAARLFCVGQPPEFVPGYFAPSGPAWTAAFRAARRLCLAEIQDAEDASSREDRRVEIRKQVLREQVAAGRGWRSVSAHDFAQTFAGERWVSSLEPRLARTDDALLRQYRDRSLRGLGPGGDNAAEWRPPQIEYVARAAERPPLRLALKEDQIVWARSPVRLDLAGGWTDTPPYTLRYGGRVVNVAVDLNGQPPIQVFCRRTPERHIRVHSIDLGETETLTRFEDVLDYRNPVSPFALPKAALCLLGFEDASGAGAALPALLDALGSGLELTLLCAVPKGSGLGTSSILGAAILAALCRFLGRELVQEELFREVLQLEQMLTTGGGWQDQIGGVTSGVKCIESRPGLRPRPVIHQLDPFLFADPSSHACFTLFYTGITRLAKRILADVVDEVNAGTKSYLFTLRHMAQLALDVKSAIERRDLPGVAEVLALSWQANKRIHPSTTNEEVEAILEAARPHFLGAKLLGAGGGGYALFLSKDAKRAEALRGLLRARFENERARLVDFSASGRGLEVTVS